MLQGSLAAVKPTDIEKVQWSFTSDDLMAQRIAVPSPSLATYDVHTAGSRDMLNTSLNSMAFI